jgi:hypothetical protein
MKKTLIIIAMILLSAGKAKVITPRCDKIDLIYIPNSAYKEIGRKIEYYGNKPVKKLDEDYFVSIDNEIYIFLDKNSDQIIGLELCCDGAQTVFIFNKDKIPDKIVKYYQGKGYSGGMSYHIEDGRRFIEKKIKYGTVLDSKYFMTKKDAKLGMTTVDAINIYGAPDSEKVISQNPKTTRYTWEIAGKYDGPDYKNVHKDKNCDSLDSGYDLLIEFQQENENEKATFIFIEHHIQ